jgi:dTDP-4-dehydrorhamnose 3,5-epimerase
MAAEVTVGPVVGEGARRPAVALPSGVTVTPLDMHPDARGVFTEVFRASWDVHFSPVQWNVVQSAQGVLRGVHAHTVHDDYLVLLSGHATVGLYDLRPGSPTLGMGVTIELTPDPITAVGIPRGVAHGFYFHAPSLHIYAVSHYWDPADELGCHWADPQLAIQWPNRDPILSVRDANLGPLADLAVHIPVYDAPAHG